MITSQPLELIQAQLGFTFQNKDLLIEAITHPSFNSVKVLRKGRSGLRRGGNSSKVRSPRRVVLEAPDYERLEFLGDRVLALAIAHWLFESYSDNEGALAKRFAYLVSRKCLGARADELLIMKPVYNYFHLQYDKSEVNSIGGNMIEALLGAMYLDQGFEAAQERIYCYWEKEFQSSDFIPEDPKTKLQELTQGLYQKRPTYELMNQEGPSHQPTFYVKVSLGDRLSHTGQGASKKEAEQKAAEALFQKIMEIKNTKP